MSIQAAINTANVNIIGKSEIFEISADNLVGQQKNKAPDESIGFIRTLDVYEVSRSYQEKIEAAFAAHGMRVALIGRSAKKSATFAVLAL